MNGSGMRTNARRSFPFPCQPFLCLLRLDASWGIGSERVREFFLAHKDWNGLQCKGGSLCLCVLCVLLRLSCVVSASAIPCFPCFPWFISSVVRYVPLTLLVR